MADIGVYVRSEVLEHKKNDGDRENDIYCYFTFSNALKVENGDRLWFAAQGRWQGYFDIARAIVMGEDEDGCLIDLNDDYTGEIARVPDPMDDDPQIEQGTEVRFYSESWHHFDGGPRKPFQGVTYKVPEA